MALSCHGPVRVLQLCDVIHVERSETSYEVPLCEYQTVLRKTAMSTSLNRCDVYRGALVEAGSSPLLATCGHRDPGFVIR